MCSDLTSQQNVFTLVSYRKSIKINNICVLIIYNNTIKSNFADKEYNGTNPTNKKQFDYVIFCKNWFNHILIDHWCTKFIIIYVL